MDKLFSIAIEIGELEYKIINTDSELMTFRLQLTKQTNHTLKFVFKVLGIEAVEKL